MSNWGSDGITRTDGNTQQIEVLKELIGEFPSKLKQAMFSAATHNRIKRGDWNGCALNQAGTEIQKSVRSIGAASEAFRITPTQVKIFISNWDRLHGTDEFVTKVLREIIESVGLFGEPGDKLPKIVSVKVYKGLQTMREEFDQIMEANEVPDEELAISFLDGSLAGV